MSCCFRDQNFGINDLAAIQDVRNEFNLEDIDETAGIKDKGMEIFFKTIFFKYTKQKASYLNVTMATMPLRYRERETLTYTIIFLLFSSNAR
jgi:hypothetical protein